MIIGAESKIVSSGIPVTEEQSSVPLGEWLPRDTRAN